jgi:hypothetical protein
VADTSSVAVVGKQGKVSVFQSAAIMLTNKSSEKIISV